MPNETSTCFDCKPPRKFKGPQGLASHKKHKHPGLHIEKIINGHFAEVEPAPQGILAQLTELEVTIAKSFSEMGKRIRAIKTAIRFLLRLLLDRSMDAIDKEISLALRSDELLRQIRKADREHWPIKSILPLLAERQQIQKELMELRGES